MFKNSVIKPSVNTLRWLKASAVRAVKTMAQTAVAMMGTAVVISDVDWKVIVSASALAGALSVLTSIAGLPEVESNEAE